MSGTSFLHVRHTPVRCTRTPYMYHSVNTAVLDILGVWLIQLHRTSFDTYICMFKRMFNKPSMYLEAEISEPAGALRYCEDIEIPDDLCLRRRNACSTNIASDVGSMRQNDPLPDSSCDRATLMKYRFNDRLCRMEFCNEIDVIHVQLVAGTMYDRSV